MAASRITRWVGFFLSLALLLGQGTRINAGMVTPVIIDPTHSFQRITTDGVNLYTLADDHSILSLPIGGGKLTTLYSGLTTPSDITTIGSQLFWIDPNSGPITDTQILTAPKSGGGPITAIYTGALVGQPIVDGSGITTDGTRLYTTDEVQGRVHSLNLDGSDLTQLGGNRYGGFFDREHTNTIAVNDGIVYIADQGRTGFSDTPPRIESILVGGGSFSTLFTGDAASFTPNGIAVGADTIFLTDRNQILEMPLTGGTPTLLVSDPRFSTHLAGLTYYNDALYVADNGSPGAIWKVDLAPASAVPEPASLTLLGIGALGVFGYGWRKRRRLA